MEISNLGKGLPCAIRKLLPQQVRRAMRLTAILLTVVCVNVSAHSYEQTVNFSGKNVPLTTFFISIEKQTGFSFFFNYALINGSKPVTINAKGMPLSKVLEKALKWQGLEYYITGKTIFIVKKKENINAEPGNGGSDDPKQIDIKGRVYTGEGTALVGATVIVKKNGRGTVTDSKGMFEIKSVPVDAILEISYAGYVTKDLPLKGDEMISVEMALAKSVLDEAQVIAYGTTTQRFSTGNTSVIRSEDIEKQPINNPLLALEGRVPGMFITQTNGLSGGGITVRIQGLNSIANGNDPLYVIDGMPYSSQSLSTVTGGVGGILGVSASTASGIGGQGNPLSFINPSDIESISVLKDADATAIYGSRAANGAILITTKKGQAGRTKIDINAQSGEGQDIRRLKLLDTHQYLQMRFEALKNDGIPMPSSTDYDINGLWDTARNTNWQNKLNGGTAQYDNVSASVSGGTLSTQYVVGGTFHRETTVFPGSYSDQKGSLHFNMNSISSNQKLRLQLNCNYVLDNNQLPINDFTTTGLVLPPDAPQLYSSVGGLNWEPNAAGAHTWTNPLNILYTVYQNRTNNLLANSVINYEIFPGLDIKSSFGYNNLITNEFSDLPLQYNPPENQATALRAAYYTSNNFNSWIVEPQVNYNKVIWKGKLNLLVGSTIQQNNSNGADLIGTGYNSDAVLRDMHSATNIKVSSSVTSVYKYNALFGRLNFIWDQKYLLDVNARRDGSSRFGPQSQFHNFYSVGAGWIFSEQDWIKNKMKLLSYGKLRLSYGITGNDQIGDYQFMNLYKPTSAGVPYQNAVGLLPSGLPNPYLQWEETRKLQGGLELSFLKDRIFVIVSYVRNRSSNQLLGYSLPIIAGFTRISENFPAVVQDEEWECNLKTNNLIKRNFSWTTNFNITIPRNKVVSFPNIALSSYATGTNGVIVGQPLGVVKAFHFLGVDPQTGKYVFADSHGNPTSSPNSLTDNKVLINTSPRVYGGFENIFRYKGLQLDFLFQYVKQTGMTPYSFSNTLEPGSPFYDQPTVVTNRWQKAGDVRQIERYTSNNSLILPFIYAEGSDLAYSDASYIRLKNVSLSWDFPGVWVKKVHLQSFKIYALGQNLATITKFAGLDPENQSSSLPPLRVITVGVQVGL